MINTVLYIESNSLINELFPFLVGHIGKYQLSSSARNLFYFSSASTKDRDASVGKFTREKPLALHTRLISLYGCEGCWILDLCSGAGTDTQPN